MTETPASSHEPPTGPVVTAEPAAQPVVPVEPVAPPQERKQSRVVQAAAWVGIVAGVVFIVTVVFGTGFVLGAKSGGGHHHGGHGDRPGMMMFHRGGPPPMAPFGPGGFFGERPGGPGAPEFGPPMQPERPQAPTTTAPRP